MDLTNLPIFLWIFFSLSGRIYCSFSVKEGLPENTYIGNIIDSDGFPQEIEQEDLKGMKCYFLKGSNSFSSYFSLNEASGVISTAMPLDRESLCKGSDICVLTLDVAFSTQTVPVKIFRFDVVVKDENDNAPLFPEGEVHLNIFEDAVIDTELSIPTAIDSDAGENSVKFYSIEPASKIFDITVTQTLEGMPGVAIVLKSRLDREAVESYSFQVVAKDGGSPQKSGVMSVTISVMDVNDNSPTFVNLPFQLTITENSPSNLPVMKVKATDKDTGENGRIRYRFTPRSTILALGVFEINPSSGEIMLISNLDYEMTKSYRLIIEAYDAGTPSRTTQTLLTVNVTDVNDNHPHLTINYLPETSSAMIPENTPVNGFVAHISATDKDDDGNDIVDCSFEHQDFKIEKLRKNEFQVSVKRSLDRERVASYTIRVNCQDRGSPTRAETVDVKVEIEDVNDNAPSFSQDVFPLMIQESRAIGQPVLTMSAFDPDEGNNAKILYEIVSSEPVSGIFSINPASGVVSVADELDRESRPEVSLVITATDYGNPARRTRASVVVEILDVNDEFPVFNKTKYEFEVVENSLAPAWIGKILATDKDSAEGGIVNYRLTGEYTDIFTINNETGEIRTLRELDRERLPVIPLTVVAFDAGIPSLSSTTTVTIMVQDLNDNAPFFNFPSSSNETLVVNKHMTPGIIAKVNASDPDLHSTLSYFLQSGFEHIFSINETSGEISARKSLSGFKNGSVFKLNLTVSDNGSPELLTRTNLYVVIGVPTKGQQTTSSVNMYIVATVLGLTLLVAIVVGAVIICLRKQDLFSKKDGGQENAQGCGQVSANNQQAKTSNSSRRNQHYLQPQPKMCNYTVQISNPEFQGEGHHEQSRYRQHTWLIDSQTTAESVLQKANVERSLSDLSGGTFDSGKGASNHSMDMRIRGEHSPRKEQPLYSPRQNDDEVFHQTHSLSTSAEVFTKRPGSPWRRVEIPEVNGRQMYETDDVTSPHSYYSESNFNGQSIFV